MAKFNYAARAKRAQSMIERFGQAGVVLKFDTKTGAQTKSYAALFYVENYSDAERNNDMIRPFDRKVILAANADATANPPSGEDRLKMLGSGETVRIVAASPYGPAGLPVYFTLQVRD